MRQFYTLTTKGDAGKYEKLEFVKPVRKMSVISDVAPAYLRLLFSDASASSTCFVPVGEPLYLDFQSANNGGGVKEIYVADNGSKTNARFSIIEYGTGGNIDWYK